MKLSKILAATVLLRCCYGVRFFRFPPILHLLHGADLEQIPAHPIGHCVYYIVLGFSRSLVNKDTFL